MSRRITKLSESPCYQCGCLEKCNKKCEENISFQSIQNSVFRIADFDYHRCGIWIALNAPEMIEIDDE